MNSILRNCMFYFSLRNSSDHEEITAELNTNSKYFAQCNRQK